MSRDLYETTVALPDATGTIKALSGVKVTVVPRGAVSDPANAVDIFQADTGVTKGPDPRSGATGTNPLITTASGSVRFWAEGPAELDVIFEDTQVPARINDRIGWNPIPGKSGSLPTSFLAKDGGIALATLAAEVKRQLCQIGQVIEWWRPSDVVPVPTGFEICDGHTVSQHDFPGISGTIVLPDLREAFVLGATTSKPDGSGSGGTDSPTDAPGIRGQGGSNNVTLTAAQSGRPAVTPTGTVTAPYSPPGGVSAGQTGIATINGDQVGVWGPIPLVMDQIPAVNASQSHSNMPKWVGLLRIMKVRYY